MQIRSYNHKTKVWKQMEKSFKITDGLKFTVDSKLMPNPHIHMET